MSHYIGEGKVNLTFAQTIERLDDSVVEAPSGLESEGGATEKQVLRLKEDIVLSQQGAELRVKAKFKFLVRSTFAKLGLAHDQITMVEVREASVTFLAPFPPGFQSISSF